MLRLQRLKDGSAVHPRLNSALADFRRKQTLSLISTRSIFPSFREIRIVLDSVSPVYSMSH